MKNTILKYKIMIGTFAGAQLAFAAASWFTNSDTTDAIILLTFLSLNVVAALILLGTFSIDNKRKIIETTQVIGHEYKEAFDFARVGLVVLDSNYRTVWTSESLTTDDVKKVGVEITSWLPEFVAFKEDPTQIIKKEIHNRTYNIKYMKETRTLILDDITLYQDAIHVNDNEATVMALIKVDNYKSIIDGVDEETGLNINVAVKGGIANWAKKYGIFHKSYAQDGYILVMDQETFEKAENDKFDFLEGIKAECAPYGQQVTLSVGIGKGIANITKLDELCKAAIERAEMRGGDQVVINTFGDDLAYYGGNSEALAINSRTEIKAVAKDVVAQIKDHDKVVVMGHKYGDYDAIASGMAVAALARSYGKEAKVIIDIPTLDVKALRNFEHYMGREYITENVINPSKAIKYVDADTLCIVVDTSVADRTEAPEILEITGTVIVLDHHRRGPNKIEDAAIEYIQPSASSTAEIITEIIEFNNADMPLNKEEINMLLTGIVLDTNHFKSTRVGERTFIASSTLKSWGADQLVADDLLKDNYDEYKLKADMIANARRLDSNTIIAVADPGVKVHTSVLAQVAQQLLGIEGVKCGFALGLNTSGHPAASARSDGDINVQVVMERVQGGGHLNAAATQRTDIDLETLEADLVEAYKR